MTTMYRIPDEATQQQFWNEWNSTFRGADYDPSVDPPTMKRRETALDWVAQLGLTQPRILDLGCATGWLTCQLAAYGSAVGIDIADASIREARERYPELEFEREDFSSAVGREQEFDVVVSLETLSHVADQRAFVRRIHDVLKPGGFLVLTTQNRVVFERREDVTPVAVGQIRQWVSPAELRRLLEDDFVVRRLTTLLPEGHLGFLRIVNSPRLNRLIGRFIGRTFLQDTKERFGLGQTIAVLAQRR